MKVCLIGSTRFADLYAEFERRLSLAGHVVHSIAVATTGDHPGLTDDEKETLDLVHLDKIAQSDAVLVVTDGSRYIGRSTRRELKWAAMQGCRVYFPQDLDFLCDDASVVRMAAEARDGLAADGDGP